MKPERRTLAGSLTLQRTLAPCKGGPTTKALSRFRTGTAPVRDPRITGYVQSVTRFRFLWRRSEENGRTAGGGDRELRSPSLAHEQRSGKNAGITAFLICRHNQGALTSHHRHRMPGRSQKQYIVLLCSYCSRLGGTRSGSNRYTMGKRPSVMK